MDASDGETHVSERSEDGSMRVRDKWAEGSRLSTRPWDVRRAPTDGCVQCGKRAPSDRRARADPRAMRVQWQVQGHFGNTFVL